MPIRVVQRIWRAGDLVADRESEHLYQMGESSWGFGVAND